MNNMATIWETLDRRSRVIRLTRLLSDIKMFIETDGKPVETAYLISRAATEIGDSVATGRVDTTESFRKRVGG